MPTRVKKPTTYQTLEEFVEKYPVLKYVAPTLPEAVSKGEEPMSVVTGAGVLSPAPLALTKGQMLMRWFFPFGRIRRLEPTPETIRAISLIMRQPRSLIEFVRDLTWRRLPDAFGTYIPSDAPDPYLRRIIEITTRKEVPKARKLRALMHELGHALSDMIITEKGKPGLWQVYTKKPLEIQQVAESFMETQIPLKPVQKKLYSLDTAGIFDIMLEKTNNPYEAVARTLDYIIESIP